MLLDGVFFTFKLTQNINGDGMRHPRTQAVVQAAGILARMGPVNWVKGEEFLACLGALFCLDYNP